MQSCSIRGCESYKSVQWKPVAYFKFPFNSKTLFNAWLKQINQKNFTPSHQDQICSTHFLIEDIEPSSIGRYPILKPDAVPSVFPEGRENIEPPKEKIPRPDVTNIIKSPITPKYETILIPDYGNKQIPILPKPNISPVTIFPQKLMQIGTNSNLITPSKLISTPIQLQTLPIASNQIRFQIPSQLVKLQSPIQLPQQLQIAQSPIVQNKSVELKSPLKKADETKSILHKTLTKVRASNGKVKTNENQKGKKLASEKKNEKKAGSPMKEMKRPILKISINKLSDEPKTQVKKIKKQPEEVLVRSSNKSVIFRLDPSGKIVVETIEDTAAATIQQEVKSSQKKEEKSPEKKEEKTPLKREEKSPLKREEKSLQKRDEKLPLKREEKLPLKREEKLPLKREEKLPLKREEKLPLKREEKTPQKSLDPKLMNLKTLYNKAQDDCEKLSKKLANLKQRHQEEQEQIHKLQGQMTMQKRSVPFNVSESTDIISKKRKVFTQNNKIEEVDVEEEDEYEKLLREVRKIKQDHQKINSKKINNKETNIKTEDISFDFNDKKSANVTQDKTINTTVSNREHKKKLQKKVTFMKEALQVKKMPAMKNNIKGNIIERKKHNLVNVSQIAKNDEIIGLIEDDVDVDFDSDDEMNYEAEYLDPEFVDC